jgi:hypothetical protein
MDTVLYRYGSLTINYELQKKTVRIVDVNRKHSSQQIVAPAYRSREVQQEDIGGVQWLQLYRTVYLA